MSLSKSRLRPTLRIDPTCWDIAIIGAFDILDTPGDDCILRIPSSSSDSGVISPVFSFSDFKSIIFESAAVTAYFAKLLTLSPNLFVLGLLNIELILSDFGICKWFSNRGLDSFYFLLSSITARHRLKIFSSLVGLNRGSSDPSAFFWLAVRSLNLYGLKPLS